MTKRVEPGALYKMNTRGSLILIEPAIPILVRPSLAGPYQASPFRSIPHPAYTAMKENLFSTKELYQNISNYD